jgi:hypothetical protein
LRIPATASIRKSVINTASFGGEATAISDASYVAIVADR